MVSRPAPQSQPGRLLMTFKTFHTLILILLYEQVIRSSNQTPRNLKSFTLSRGDPYMFSPKVGNFLLKPKIIYLDFAAEICQPIPLQKLKPFELVLKSTLHYFLSSKWPHHQQIKTDQTLCKYH